MTNEQHLRKRIHEEIEKDITKAGGVIDYIVNYFDLCNRIQVPSCDGCKHFDEENCPCSSEECNEHTEKWLQKEY